ncbi:MAG: uroporphyrinogen-III synthase [Rhodospirillaceae bacterium]|nr:uroporphyrinogen-III synthase [Rhodospirillaceae bacterium]
MRILITSPGPEAANILAALSERGHDATSVPLITPERIEAPELKLEGAQGFLVTSAEGVRALADAIAVRFLPVFAENAEAAKAAEDAGFLKVSVSGGDASDFAKLIKETVNSNAGALLHACHTHETTAVTEMLVNMGYAVRPLKLYTLKQADALPMALVSDLKAGVLDGSIVLSVDEARAFTTLLQCAELEHLVKGWVVYATSILASAPMRALAVSRTVVAPNPDIAALLAAFDKDLAIPPEPEQEPYVSDKPVPEPIDPDQRSQSNRGQTRKKERSASDLEPNPIPDAPLPGNQPYVGQQQKQAAARAKKSGGFGQFVACIVLLIVVLTAVFGTMPWWHTRMPPIVQNWIPETLWLPTAQIPSTTVADITSLQQGLTATEAKVASLRQAIQPSAQSEGPNTQALETTLSALQQRLAAIEARFTQSSAAGVSSNIKSDAVTALGNAAAKQGQQLVAVTARIAAVEAALGSAALLDVVIERIDALEDRSADAATVLALAGRISQLEAVANSSMNKQSGAIALLLAASQLQDAVSNGRPYALELETVLAFAAKQKRLSIDIGDLAVHQSAGVPTRAALRQQFDRLAPAAVRAGLLPSDTASWLQRTLNSLFAMISVRRLDDDGSAGVGAIVTRMERALDIGDLEAAVTAAESLSGLAGETVSPWLTKARATASVERAVTTLSNQAIAQMNAGRDFEPATPEADD